MKKLVALTLAANGERCLADPSSIVFVLGMNGETEDKEPFKYSRVFLKSPTFDNGDNWVDVKETVDEIRRICK